MCYQQRPKHVQFNITIFTTDAVRRVTQTDWYGLRSVGAVFGSARRRAEPEAPDTAVTWLIGGGVHVTTPITAEHGPVNLA